MYAHSDGGLTCAGEDFLLWSNLRTRLYFLLLVEESQTVNPKKKFSAWERQWNLKGKTEKQEIFEVSCLFCVQNFGDFTAELEGRAQQGKTKGQEGKTSKLFL